MKTYARQIVVSVCCYKRRSEGRGPYVVTTARAAE